MLANERWKVANLVDPDLIEKTALYNNGIIPFDELKEGSSGARLRELERRTVANSIRAQQLDEEIEAERTRSLPQLPASRDAGQSDLPTWLQDVQGKSEGELIQMLWEHQKSRWTPPLPSLASGRETMLALPSSHKTPRSLSGLPPLASSYSADLGQAVGSQEANVDLNGKSEAELIAEVVRLRRRSDFPARPQPAVSSINLFLLAISLCSDKLCTIARPDIVMASIS